MIGFSKEAPICITKRQADVLGAINSFVEEKKYPPTITELCRLCGVYSTSTIHFHLTALKKKGVVNWNPYEKRTLSVIGKAVKLMERARYD